MADFTTIGTHSVDTGWHHVTYVKSGNDHRLYLDAVEDITVLDYPMFTLVPTCLMLYFDGGPTGLPPISRLTACKMWTAALSPAEITAEMAGYGQVRTADRYNETHLSVAEAINDSSGLGHDFIIDPNAPGELFTVVDGPNGAMVSSVRNINDGVGDGTAIAILSNLPTSIVTGDFTAMVWLRAQDATGETSIFRFSNDDNLGGTPQIQFNLQTDRFLNLILNNYLQTLTLSGGLSASGAITNPAAKTAVIQGTVNFVADETHVMLPPRYSVQQEFNVTIAGRRKLRLPPISIANTPAHHTVRSQQIIDALTGNISADLLSDDPSIGDVPISVLWSNTANFAYIATFANSASFWRNISEFQAGPNITFTPNGAAVVITASTGVVTFAEASNTANTASYLNGVSTYQAGAGVTFTPNGTAIVIAAPSAAGTNGYGHTIIAGQANLVALTGNSGLTIVAGNGVVLTTNVASDGAVHVAVNGVQQIGNTTITGFANITTTLQVTGNTQAGNTNVTGWMNVSSTLNVAGLTTLTGNATLSGFANIAQTLNVAGISQLTGNTTLSGFANIAQTLNVAGISQLTGNTTLSGFANIAGKLVVAGNAAITGNLTQTGNATFSGFVNVATTLQVTGLTTLTGNATLSGFANIAQTLNVAGISQLTGNVTFSGFANIATTLQVTGNTQAGNVNVTGFLNVSTTFNVAGNTTLVGNATLSANLIVNGLTTANAGLVVNGTVQFNNTITANNIVGTAGWVLTSGGAGANAYWAAVSAPSSTTNSFGVVEASGVANLVALTGNSVLTFVAGNGILFTGNVASDGAFHIAVNGAQQLGNTTVTGFANITSTLQVDGTIIHNNTITANGVVGSAGDVLTSGGAAANVYWAAGGGPGGTTNSFGHSVISGQANLVALTGNSALTIVAGSGITLTTNVASDGALHIASTAASGFTLYDAGSSGTTKTIDWTNGPAQYLLMTGNCTITLSNPVDGGRYVLTANSGAGGFSITWPASVFVPDSRVPVQTQTANKIDLYTLFYISALGKYLLSYNQNFG